MDTYFQCDGERRVVITLWNVTKGVAGALGSFAGGEAFTLQILTWLAFQRSEVLSTTMSTSIPFFYSTTRSHYRRDHGM